MNARNVWCYALGVLLCSTARAAPLRPGTPRLLDPEVTTTCVVPATFTTDGTPRRVLFFGSAAGISVKPEGKPTRLLWSRLQLRGGEQRSSGVFLASSVGLLYSPDGVQSGFIGTARFSLVTPFGWVWEPDGLWSLSDQGFFSRVGGPSPSWRAVTGVAPSSNYLYGPNLLWVGIAPGLNVQRGLFQVVVVNGASRSTYGIPDFQRVTALAGVTGGHCMVYSGLVLRHMESDDPLGLFYMDVGLPADRYTLQSLRFGPDDIDAVAYVGRTLWVNLKSGQPTSIFLPGIIRCVALDPARRELLVCTSAGVYAVPYTLA
jgi:hypothetical protein